MLFVQEEEEGDEDSMTFWTAEELPDNDPTVLRASSWRHPAIVSAGAQSRRCSSCNWCLAFLPSHALQQLRTGVSRKARHAQLQACTELVSRRACWQHWHP